MLKSDNYIVIAASSKARTLQHRDKAHRSNMSKHQNSSRHSICLTSRPPGSIVPSATSARRLESTTKTLRPQRTIVLSHHCSQFRADLLYRLMGVVCCLICICAACLPCLCGWFQETDHYCSKCNKKVTHKPHDGPVQVMQGQTAHMVPSQYAWNSPQPGQPQSVAVPQQAQVHQDPKQRYEAQMQEHREQQMREQSQPGPQAPPSYSAQQ